MVSCHWSLSDSKSGPVGCSAHYCGIRQARHSNAHDAAQGADGCCCTDLLCTLDAQANMSIVVADNNKGLEPGSLTGTCLLLHWHDLHDLVLEGRAQEGLHNLVLLHRHGEEVDLLQGLYLALQYHFTTHLRSAGPVDCIGCYLRAEADSAVVAQAVFDTEESLQLLICAHLHIGAVIIAVPAEPDGPAWCRAPTSPPHPFCLCPVHGLCRDLCHLCHLCVLQNHGQNRHVLRHGHPWLICSSMNSNKTLKQSFVCFTCTPLLSSCRGLYHFYNKAAAQDLSAMKLTKMLCNKKDGDCRGTATTEASNQCSANSHVQHAHSRLYAHLKSKAGCETQMQRKKGSRRLQ